MPEGDRAVIYREHRSTTGKWILIAAAALYAAAAAGLIFMQQSNLEKLSQDQVTRQKELAELSKRMQSVEGDSETLAQQLRMTKKDLATTTAQLRRQQQAASARSAAEAAELKKNVGEVAGEVGAVKTDVGGVKTDVAATKESLEQAIAKLQNTIGDLGVQSGLMANTRADLEALKRRGDRQYYEFTLIKGARPKAYSTVALQLRKTNPKKGRYTLDVTADDKTIEKKDRNESEPVQFYTGRDHMLYELVVWTVNKKRITGYLSTPKDAPTPITASSL